MSLSWANHVQASQIDYEDIFLKKVISAYQIEPMVTKLLSMGDKEKLGQMLFFDPIMGGQTIRLVRHVISVVRVVLMAYLWP